MSKSEILNEFARLTPEDRREVFEGICEIEERQLLVGSRPTVEEMILLDREREDYLTSPEAGASWDDVEARIRRSGPA